MSIQNWFVAQEVSIQDSQTKSSLSNTFDTLEQRVQDGFDGVDHEFETIKDRVWGNTMIYVDPIRGFDVPENGSANCPYKTINYAYSQVPVVPNTQDGADQWLLEKIVFWCAPGIYTEGGTFNSPVDAVVGIKRARVSVQGDGVYIRGNLAFKYDISWVPGGWNYNTLYRPTQKFPYDATSGTSTLVCFDVSGDTGGMEAGHASMNIMVGGAVQIQYGNTAGGPSNAWQAMFGPMQSQMSMIQTFNGLNIMAAPGETAVGNCSCTVEIDSSSIVAVNGGFLGSSLAGTPLSLKAHNSQLRAIIGGYTSILEIDNCRIQGGIDRTYGGIAGNITFSNASSYSGIRDCATPTTLWNIGNGTASTIIYTDSMTTAKLATTTLNAGTGNASLYNYDVIAVTTAARPAYTKFNIGQQIFDTTLGKPLWRGSTSWVDATGAAV